MSLYPSGKHNFAEIASRFGDTVKKQSDISNPVILDHPPADKFW